MFLISKCFLYFFVLSFISCVLGQNQNIKSVIISKGPSFQNNWQSGGFEGNISLLLVPTDNNTAKWNYDQAKSFPWFWLTDCGNWPGWVQYDIMQIRKIQWVYIADSTWGGSCMVKVAISPTGIFNGEETYLFRCAENVYDNRFYEYCDQIPSEGLNISVPNIEARYVRWTQGRVQKFDQTAFRNMFVGAAYICDPSPGQYCLSDSQPVQDCPPNVYCPMNTSLQIACPLNTGNSGNAWLVSHCISKPGYYGSPGLEATQCAPGSYANTPGNIQCLQCPPGFTTTESTGFLNCVEVC